jgi:hypothetical protein
MINKLPSLTKTVYVYLTIEVNGLGEELFFERDVIVPMAVVRMGKQ